MSTNLIELTLEGFLKSNLEIHNILAFKHYFKLLIEAKQHALDHKVYILGDTIISREGYVWNILCQPLDNLQDIFDFSMSMASETYGITLDTTNPIFEEYEGEPFHLLPFHYIKTSDYDIYLASLTRKRRWKFKQLPSFDIEFKLKQYFSDSFMELYDKRTLELDGDPEIYLFPEFLSLIEEPKYIIEMYESGNLVGVSCIVNTHKNNYYVSIYNTIKPVLKPYIKYILELLPDSNIHFGGSSELEIYPPFLYKRNVSNTTLLTPYYCPDDEAYKTGYK